MTDHPDYRTFAKLLNAYHSEALQVIYRDDKAAAWGDNVNRLILKYSLAALVLTPDKADLSTLLQASRKQVETLATMAICHDMVTPELRERALALGWITLKTIGVFRSRLWGAASRLFQGGRSPNFTATFYRVIDDQLSEAWNAGAKEAGVMPDEMGQDDFTVLEAIIANEYKFVDRMANDILNAKDAGMDPEQFSSQFGARVDLWTNRYLETVNRAKMHFGSKKRYIWKLGATEEHCPECSALNNLVAFGYEFEEAGIQPQAPPNPALTCLGFRCSCILEPTTKRRSARALDQLTNIAMRHAGKI